MPNLYTVSTHPIIDLLKFFKAVCFDKLVFKCDQVTALCPVDQCLRVIPISHLVVMHHAGGWAIRRLFDRSHLATQTTGRLSLHTSQLASTDDPDQWQTIFFFVRCF